METSRIVENFSMTKIVENLQQYICTREIHRSRQHNLLEVEFFVVVTIKQTKIFAYTFLFQYQATLRGASPLLLLEAFMWLIKIHDYLFVMVEHWNKMCLFISFVKKSLAWEETELLCIHFCVHFLFPSSIIYD